MKILAIGSLWLGVGISAFCRPVLRIMTVPSYHETYRLVPIVVLPHVFTGMAYFFQTGIFYKKQTRKILLISAIAGAVQLMVNFLLIPKFGEYGAAWAQLLFAVIAAALTYVISMRLYPIRYEYHRVVLIFIIGFGFLAASRFLPVEPSSLYREVLWGVLLSIGYPFSLWVVRSLTREDLSTFKHLIEPIVGKMRLLLSRKSE